MLCEWSNEDKAEESFNKRKRERRTEDHPYIFMYIQIITYMMLNVDNRKQNFGISYQN